MWADQIRAEEPQLAPLESKQEVVGYAVEQTDKDAEEDAPNAGTVESESAPEPQATKVVEEETSAEEPAPGDNIDNVEEPAPVPAIVETEAESGDKAPETSFATVAASEPTSDSAVVNHKPEPSTSSGAPVAFPSSDAPVSFPSGPISFPSTDEPEGEADPTLATSPTSGGVTFDDSVRGSPRSGTPDPSDPKRKRTASQNFQRFARRVSLVGRRQGSVPSVGFAQKDRRESKDEGSDRGEASGSGFGDDSPAASVQEGKKMKEKLKKRLSMGKS